MANGTAVHVGLANVDASVWGVMPAPGCDAAASDMAGLTKRLGYAGNTVLANQAATKAAVLAAIQAAIAGLSDGDMLCLSYAGHGIAYDDNSGSPQVAFMMYDTPWLRGEFLRMLTTIDKRIRIAVVVLACYGPLSETTTKAVESYIASVSGSAVRILPLPQARQFWTSPVGWQLWANAHFGFTVSSPASVLILAASRGDELAQATLPGRRLPTFTDALISGVPNVQNYAALVTYIQGQMAASGSLSTPVLNRSLVRPDDQGFVTSKPFSLP